MKRHCKILTVLGTIALAATFAAAEKAGGPAGGDRDARVRGPAGQPMLQALKQLDLTEQQEQQIQKILKESRRQGGQAKDGQARGEAFAQVRKQISDILTPEQRRQLRQQFNQQRPGRRGPEGAGDDGEPAADGREGADKRPQMMGRYGQLDLTDAQRQQIREILEQAHERIRHKVLTESQRQKLQDMPRDGAPGRLEQRRRGPGEGREAPQQERQERQGRRNRQDRPRTDRR